MLHSRYPEPFRGRIDLVTKVKCGSGAYHDQYENVVLMYEHIRPFCLLDKGPAPYLERRTKRRHGARCVVFMGCDRAVYRFIATHEATSGFRTDGKRKGYVAWKKFFTTSSVVKVQKILISGVQRVAFRLAMTRTVLMWLNLRQPLCTVPFDLTNTCGAWR